MFNEPEAENEIGPVEGLIDESRPRLYRNVKNYGDINYKCYQEGKIALETVKIADNSNQRWDCFIFEFPKDKIHLDQPVGKYIKVFVI